MQFKPRLAQGALIKRYKRFLADVKTASGSTLTIHCPNTGSMTNCLREGGAVWYSYSDNPKRKYAHTWEIATTPAGDLAGVNTHKANHLVREAIESGKVDFLTNIESIRSEVPYGKENSRIDFVVRADGGEFYVEVKSVTLCEGSGKGFFPDTVSVRGAKHLRELAALAEEGKKAVLIYCVQHSGIDTVAPARHIDPAYSQAFDAAVISGVTVIALKAKITPVEIVLELEIPVVS